MSYELLENDLTHSTLWMLCSKDAKLLFVTILAECRGYEIVRTPLPVLFRLAGLTDEEGASALAELVAPDPQSRNPAEDGRRVVQIEDEEGRGLWLPSYRHRRERYFAANRQAAKRDRARHAASHAVTPSHGPSRSVTVSHAESQIVRPDVYEMRSDIDEKKKRGERARFTPPDLIEVERFARESLPTLNGEEFWDFYQSKGWKVGAQPMRDWKAAARRWSRRPERSENAKPSFNPTPHTVPQIDADSPPPTEEQLAEWKAKAEAEVHAAFAPKKHDDPDEGGPF